MAYLKMTIKFLTCYVVEGKRKKIEVYRTSLSFES